MNNKYTVSYSQNREDIILSAFFRHQNKGFYIDVGANDPQHDSVTKYFYERGWNGINIEPSPMLYKKLSNERKRDINLNVGISNNVGKLSFREYEGDGLSTFSEITKEELIQSKHPLAKKFKDYDVEVTTLVKIFEDYNVKDVDFMKIDVEGYEYEVISSNNWKKYRPKVLCIEANHIQNEWHKILSSNSYQKVFNDGLNDYFIDTKIMKPEDFKYIESVIGRSIISSDIASDYNALQIQKRKLELLVLDLKDEISDLKIKNNELRQEIVHSKRLRGSAKLFYRSIDNAISIQLNKIDNGGVRSGINNLPKINISQLSNKSKKDALDEVRIWDQKTLPLTQNINFEISRSISYKAANDIYVFSKKSAKYLLKSVYRSIKKSKKGANK